MTWVIMVFISVAGVVAVLSTIQTSSVDMINAALAVLCGLLLVLCRCLVMCGAIYFVGYLFRLGWISADKEGE